MHSVTATAFAQHLRARTPSLLRERSWPQHRDIAPCTPNSTSNTNSILTLGRRHKVHFCFQMFADRLALASAHRLTARVSGRASNKKNIVKILAKSALIAKASREACRTVATLHVSARIQITLGSTAKLVNITVDYPLNIRARAGRAVPGSALRCVPIISFFAQLAVKAFGVVFAQLNKTTSIGYRQHRQIVFKQQFMLNIASLCSLTMHLP